MQSQWQAKFNDLKLNRAQIEYAIDQYIVGYPNCGRDRNMLLRRLLDGAPLETLGDEFGLSASQTKRIVRIGVSTLLDRIGEKPSAVRGR